MAKRKATENTSSDAIANPDGAPEQAQTSNDLPVVESPSLSPATPEIAAVPVAIETPVEPVAAREDGSSGTAVRDEQTAPAATPEIVAAVERRRFIVRPRHKRHALLAASVAIAAVFGGMIGAVTTGGFSRPVAVDVASVEENKATQQSVARLTEEIASLKTSLEAANKSVRSQFAKLGERLNRESAEITGSIKPPQTVPPSLTPLPTPRPAASEIQRPTRASILADWSIRDTRDGYVYVQGHGDVYQVVPGAPLPGVGPVEQIKRQDGRWVVVTPKGIIVSMRDRRYFEQF